MPGLWPKRTVPGGVQPDGAKGPVRVAGFSPPGLSLARDKVARIVVVVKYYHHM